jgi:hypothetical protein
MCLANSCPVAILGECERKKGAGIMLDAFLAFLKNPANRDAVGWIGAGIVVVASGLWPVIKFLSKKKNCWTWIELGDLWMVRGSLAEA